MYPSMILSGAEIRFLKMVMAADNWSILELSKWLEEPYGRVREYLKGIRPVPLKTRFKIIEVLDISLKLAELQGFVPSEEKRAS